MSPLEGIGRFASATHADGADVPAAVGLAAAADAVVLVLGLRSEAGARRLNFEEGGGEGGGMDEGEGMDRTSLLLPPEQAALVRAVASAVRGSMPA